MPAVFQSQQIKHRVSGRVLFELSGGASVKACVEALLAALDALDAADEPEPTSH